MAERPLNPDEQALWRRVVETVAPLPGRPAVPVVQVRTRPARKSLVQTPIPAPAPPPSAGPGRTLDARWDRDLKRGAVAPDRTIDLHDRTLADAHALVDSALDAARRDGARVLLLITGKARADARGGDGRARGAIRAQVHDWLAASRHAGAIAAVRPAHPRHGGAGALYVILRRR